MRTSVLMVLAALVCLPADASDRLPPSTAPMQWSQTTPRFAKTVAGWESGRTLPVCRASHAQGVHPGKVVDGKCNIGWGGKELSLSDFEVLTGGGSWRPKGTAGAFVAGSENGQPLLLCLASVRGGGHPGKVVAGKCNIGYGGAELAFDQYQVFVPTIRSADTGDAVELVMMNGTGTAVDVYWITMNGELQSYGRLDAGARRVQPTYRGHVWEFRRGGSSVGRHTATPAKLQFAGVGASPRTTDVDAGPLPNQQEADAKCASVCRARDAMWNGQWKTTGNTSVCGCTGFF